MPAAQRGIYPTRAGGREWHLSDDADLNADATFVPSYPDVIVVRSGPHTTYHTEGDQPGGAVRLHVRSPHGAAWWRNVEMTGYFRITSIAPAGGQWPHLSMAARGERHTDNTVTKARIWDAPPPPGTATWPWYDALLPGDVVVPGALGTAYYGNVYADHGGDVSAQFMKEVAHPDAYAEPRGRVRPKGLPPRQGAWFGMKYVVRNDAAATAVGMELWIDADATGEWTKVSDYVDRNGAGDDWTVEPATLDGAAAPPYLYAPNQLITWAGPAALFRADGLAFDFRDLSVREIDPY